MNNITELPAYVFKNFPYLEELWVHFSCWCCVCSVPCGREGWASTAPCHTLSLRLFKVTMSECCECAIVFLLCGFLLLSDDQGSSSSTSPFWGFVEWQASDLHQCLLVSCSSYILCLAAAERQRYNLYLISGIMQPWECKMTSERPYLGGCSPTWPWHVFAALVHLSAGESSAFSFSDTTPIYFVKRQFTFHHTVSWNARQEGIGKTMVSMATGLTYPVLALLLFCPTLS